MTRVTRTLEVQLSSSTGWLSRYFKGVAVAFATKDPKTHLNSEDASQRGFRGKTEGKRKGKKQGKG